MKRTIILAALLLTGCLEDQKTQAITCYDVIANDNAAPALRPILINKCTGETWVALQSPLPKKPGQYMPDRIWRWYRMDSYAVENVVAGQ